MTNLALTLAEATAMYPERAAVRLDELVLTYQGLDERSARVAGLLAAHNVEPGDRVGLPPNVPQFPMLYYGVLRAGAVVVPMNPLLKAREIAYYLEDSGAKLLFAWDATAAEAGKGAEAAGVGFVSVAPAAFDRLLGEPAPETAVASRADHDTAVLLYTSGTTGKPKGAELTHANLRRRGVGDHPVRPRTRGRGHGLPAAVPLLRPDLRAERRRRQRCRLTLVPRFDPATALEVIQRDQVTVFQGVPTMYAALLNHPHRRQFDVGSLRLCVSGGAALPVEVLRGFEDAFGCVILEGYGLSETSPVASFNHPDRERKPGSIGTPIQGVEMRLVGSAGEEVAAGEVGEIAIRGHNLMRGYWGRETRPARRSPTAGFAPATWPARTRTATSSSSTAKGPDHPRRL